MARTPYQFRFYSDNDPRNYPIGLKKSDLTEGNIFDKYNLHFITQIGIQGTPGVQFKINNGKSWIEIGRMGIYELDLTNKGNIESIQFNKNNYFGQVNPETNISSLFIDVIYKSEDKQVSVIQDNNFYNEYNSFDLIISGGNSTLENN